MAKILIAGEDYASLTVLEAELAAACHEVIVVHDGQLAYEAALEIRPDMVFLEVSMPVFDGYETCQMMRNDPDLPPALPIIFLTSPDANDRRLEKAGATGRLPKKHDTWQVPELLSQYLAAFPGYPRLEVPG